MSIERLQFETRDEWLQNRTRIGGSDAAAIIGLNPWRTNVELWEIKTGKRKPDDISDKPFVIYGVLAEEHIRALFALDFPEYEVEYYGDNMILNDEFSFAAASLDGELLERETGRRGILEIKTTEILRSMQKEKWRDQIPENYYCQIIHYLMVTGYEFAVLVAQLKFNYDGEIVKHTRHYKIERADVTADIEYLAAAEAAFWDQVQNNVEPPLLLKEI